MKSQEFLSNLFFYWQHKLPEQNQWRPLLNTSTKNETNSQVPTFFERLDLEAAAVDTAPFVVGAGGITHLRQALDFGLTARASIFHNLNTLRTMHRAVMFVTPVVLAAQMLRIDYRSFIPRWASERERRRFDNEVRSHVGFGMLAGAALYVSRLYIFRAGRAYWAPIDVVMGGALTDLMHREYLRAHNM